MAINGYANVTLDPSSSKKTDRSDFRNTTSPGTAAAGNLAVGWDNTVITRMTLWDACVADARRIAASQLPP